VQALRSFSEGEERVVGSLWSLDLVPVSICFKSRSDGEGMRSAMDCSALEGPLPRSLEVEAGSTRAAVSVVDEAGMMKLLGLINLKLDWILIGRTSKPSHRRKKVRILGLADSVLGWASGPVSKSLDPSLAPGVDPVLDPVVEPGLDLGLEPVLDLGSNLDLVSNSDAGVFFCHRDDSRAFVGAPFEIRRWLGAVGR
jgi:hypothetical protein